MLRSIQRVANHTTTYALSFTQRSRQVRDNALPAVRHTRCFARRTVRCWGAGERRQSADNHIVPAHGARRNGDSAGSNPPAGRTRKGAIDAEAYEAMGRAGGG